MKILFDGRYIGTNTQEILPAGGIGRYSFHLLRHLVEKAQALDLTILVPKTNHRPIFPDAFGRVREIQIGNRPSSLHTQFLLAKTLDSQHFDLFHSPFNMLPRGLQCKSVVTVHDIMWLTSPELCARFLPERLAASLLYRLGIHHALKRANRIITVSHSAGTAISRYLPNCTDRIESIHHGVEPFFKKISDEEALRDVKDLFQPPATFILCVGQGSPYKNHFRAVQAFLHAFEEKPEIKLVLVRRFQRFDREMRALLQQPQARERVIPLPFVSEKELRALYNLADIFFFPSLEEGFGLPVLEAMACGTPVLTSDIPVMHEVAGDAALFGDPCHTESLTERLTLLIHDKNLQHQLIERGKAHILNFSWSACASQTLQCYQQTLVGSHLQ